MMSSYEGDHVTAVNTVLCIHSTAVSRTLHIGRNPPTTAPSTCDDVTLQGSPGTRRECGRNPGPAAAPCRWCIRHRASGLASVTE
jgi:hypothetical protein